MQLEKESKKLEELVKLNSKLPSVGELELKLQKASRELEQKSDKLEVSFIMWYELITPKSPRHSLPREPKHGSSSPISQSRFSLNDKHAVINRAAVGVRGSCFAFGLFFLTAQP